ncbi:sugar transferase [Rhizobium sp. TH2]|uniref:sugar transferase n=1 Tax=Rhizobium sp. TH2 TaxID=2775403 RepID=UPI00215864D6|nr:sugar transferase [Rhizobium sp. TH2]UVC11667.1 sugar transferase [Rhizobium sp. TH2]
MSEMDAGMGSMLLQPVAQQENIDARQFGAYPSQLIFKRAVDIAVSFGALLVLSPFFIIIALAIKFTSPGPVLFRQVRWGLDQRTFEVLKFRSMRFEECDTSGVAQTVENDPRLTLVGSWFRKSNIDELPQLFNVLIGDMSLVGPRCHPVGMLACGKPYEELVSNYHQRHKMRPGITGLAQVRGLRGPTVQGSKARQRIVCDLYYIQHFSLWLDVKIIACTIKNELFGGTGF